MVPPPLDIADVLARGRRVDVEETIVLDRPFWQLHLFRKSGRGRHPEVLIVTPLSGHFGWLMRDLVVGLLARHDVFLLEWKDAREVPLSAGRFDLSDNIAAVIDAVRLLGPDIALLGVSQAPTAILAASALLAEDRDPARPRAIVLMGGFLDPRINPTAIERLASRLPPGWFSHVMATTVPAGYPGAGRRVYRGDIHGRTLARYLARHIATGGELARKVRADDGSDPERFPFLRLFSTLMDLPAEFAEDNVQTVFRDHLLARGELFWRGRRIDPSAVDDIALMTVEGGGDDTSGVGQTLVAHALCHRLPYDERAHCHEPAAGHFGLFHGEPWRSHILPEVEAFLAQITD
ncbi:MAG: polyhydroxyalkanoate depolymerase [Magnetospirillum sp.]|nr:polyhydroxyalkanoate depolymerase [Magnetospirillum sp.]